MIEIKLASGDTALLSDEDEHIANHKWFLQKRAKNKYAARFVKENGKTKMVLMHRAVLGFRQGDPTVDHIDGNGLNNQRSNLRPCIQRENSRNVGLPKHNTSGYLGVTKTSYGKYIAQIHVLGETKYLGLFATAEEANSRRLEVEKEIWGVTPRRATAHLENPE